MGGHGAFGFGKLGVEQVVQLIDAPLEFRGEVFVALGFGVETQERVDFAEFGDVLRVLYLLFDDGA